MTVCVCIYMCHTEKVSKFAYLVRLFCILCACFTSVLRLCIFLSFAHRHAHMHCAGLYPSVCACVRDCAGFVTERARPRARALYEELLHNGSETVAGDPNS